MIGQAVVFIQPEEEAGSRSELAFMPQLFQVSRPQACASNVVIAIVGSRHCFEDTLIPPRQVIREWIALRVGQDETGHLVAADDTIYRPPVFQAGFEDLGDSFNQGRRAQFKMAGWQFRDGSRAAHAYDRSALLLFWQVPGGALDGGRADVECNELHGGCLLGKVNLAMDLHDTRFSALV